MLDPTPELPDDTLITDVEFPTRMRNALVAAGLKIIREVHETSDKILWSFQDLGKVRWRIFARAWVSRQRMGSGLWGRVLLDLQRLPRPRGVSS